MDATIALIGDYFGLNADHVDEPVAAAIILSGIDQDNEPRIVELPDKRYFVVTRFVPQTSSTPDAPHPVVRALVAAAHSAPSAAATTRQPV